MGNEINRDSAVYFDNVAAPRAPPHRSMYSVTMRDVCVHMYIGPVLLSQVFRTFGKIQYFIPNFASRLFPSLYLPSPYKRTPAHITHTHILYKIIKLNTDYT